MKIERVGVEVVAEFEGIRITILNTHGNVIIYKVSQYYDSKWQEISGSARELILKSIKDTEQHDEAIKIIKEATKKYAH